MMVGSLLKILADSNFFNSGWKQGAGLTKFVEFIPNKKDSISAVLTDNLLY